MGKNVIVLSNSYAHIICPGWWRGLVVSSPPAIGDTGAMGREIESRQGKGNYFKKIRLLS
jgi:hypothetical protein